MVVLFSLFSSFFPYFEILAAVPGLVQGTPCTHAQPMRVNHRLSLVGNAGDSNADAAEVVRARSLASLLAPAHLMAVLCAEDAPMRETGLPGACLNPGSPSPEPLCC